MSQTFCLWSARSQKSANTSSPPGSQSMMIFGTPAASGSGSAAANAFGSIPSAAVTAALSASSSWPAESAPSSVRRREAGEPAIFLLLCLSAALLSAVLRCCVLPCTAVAVGVPCACGLSLCPLPPCAACLPPCAGCGALDCLFVALFLLVSVVSTAARLLQAYRCWTKCEQKIK